MNKISIVYSEGKTIHWNMHKKNKAVINQLPRFGIGFGIVLAAIPVHRVEPANYISCG
jgi:hypothetical protein